MKDYKSELSKGIYLEDYNILVEWQINQNELFDKISKFNNFERGGNIEFKVVTYCIRSKILGSTDKFTVVFCFVKNKLTSVSLGKEIFNLSIQEYFAQMQFFLESKLGKPDGIATLLTKTIKDKEDEVYKWHIKIVRIVHSLFDLKSRTTLEIII